MKYLIVLLSIILFSCTNKNEVYWCGDHACINNKEKKAYFEKTLTIEIKDLAKQKRKKSEFEVIKEKAGLNSDKEKELDNKIEVVTTNEEKALAKQLRLEKKKRIKEEKALAKQLRLEKKKRIKEEKKYDKKVAKKADSKINLDANVINEKNIDSSVEFNEFVKKIHKKNLFRSYPDINDIPN